MAKFVVARPIIAPDSFEREIIDTTGTTTKIAESALNVVSVLAGSGTSISRTYDVVADPDIFRQTAATYLDAYNDMLAYRINEVFKK